MSKLMEIYKNRMLNYLTNEAKGIIRRARMTKETGNRSYTQRDAYGALICFQGRVAKTVLTASTSGGGGSYHGGNYEKMDDLGYGERHKGWNGIPDGTGVEWANEFARSYKPQTKGWELVVFNAAFYSKIQEEGGGRLKRTYNIISQIFGDMDAIAAKFRGAQVTGYNLKR